MTRDPNIEALFPSLLRNGYEIQSPDDPAYNCIAWAASNTTRWWWPLSLGGYYWPPSVPMAVTLDSFIKAFEEQGYSVCETAELEAGYEKIAIYADSNSIPTHAARQVPSGSWTSKLGSMSDIEHGTLEGLEGSAYGSARLILRRAIGGDSSAKAAPMKQWPHRLQWLVKRLWPFGTRSDLQPRPPAAS